MNAPLKKTQDVSEDNKSIHSLSLFSKKGNRLYELAYEATNQCIQCGYCLPACPTYESMGKESASPRGRINLVKMAAEGKIDISSHLSEPIDLCLGCRACEVACPVGVPYGHILETAKNVIAEEQMNNDAGTMNDNLKHLVLSQVFPYPKRMRLLGNLTWFYQKSGIRKMVKKTKLLHKISEPLAQIENVLPLVESPLKRNKLGTIIPAKGSKKARVAFFTGCISDALLNRTNRLSIELLTVAGCEVIIPKSQNCCGALHAHQGMIEGAKELAKQNISAFEESESQYYINNAGGCGALLKEYEDLMKNDEEWAERAKKFSRASRDISEILVEFGPLPFKKQWNGVITYQDSCHLRNVQRVHEQPRKLLKSVPGAAFVELSGSDKCCASGGIYNLLHFGESMEILDGKMENIEETKAATVVTTNPGCLLQMRLGIERKGCSGQVQGVHLVDVLAEACGIS
ncbi:MULTISPECIES: (Fe-S)-binding protein [Bacillaceae]|uniref:(Fe-S)-binding protein n=1 Tax=Bacillaceae TaxID=186817 RepID=UPI001A8F90C6|nr:(Fe-S)-binding protein [Bacillus sp. NTK034]MBN8201907.1 (Fe-S)-binding protein [Bacillus sp. NTK034]